MVPAQRVTRNENNPQMARSMRNCVIGCVTPRAYADFTMPKWTSGVNGERNPALAAISATECDCAGRTREMTSP